MNSDLARLIVVGIFVVIALVLHQMNNANHDAMAAVDIEINNVIEMTTTTPSSPTSTSTSTSTSTTTTTTKDWTAYKKLRENMYHLAEELILLKDEYMNSLDKSLQQNNDVLNQLASLKSFDLDKRVDRQSIHDTLQLLSDTIKQRKKDAHDFDELLQLRLLLVRQYIERLQKGTALPPQQ
jgi:uncharacterized protein (DUF342 family)